MDYRIPRQVWAMLFLSIPVWLSGFVVGTWYEDYHHGQFHVEVVSVHDGDTFMVNIPEWPEAIGRRLSVRIKGVDTPELNDKDIGVQAIAEAAREKVAYRLLKAKKVQLKNISRDKYFRIDADVIADGVNVGQELLNTSLAKPYDGGKKPEW